MSGNRILGLLSRVTSSGKFIPEIDGLRFVAIISVVIFHLSAWLVVRSQVPWAAASKGDLAADLAHHGDIGVRLFFMISGLILTMPFASHYLLGKQPVRLKNYYLRRVTRIEPPYVINMVVLTVILVVLQGLSFAILLPHLVASLFYVHAIAYGRMSDINYVAWSLEVEVMFYLLAPFLARVFTIKSKQARRGVLLGAMLLIVPIQVMLTQAVPWTSMTIINQFQFFLAGFLLADVYLLDWNSEPKRSLAWDLLTVVSAVLTTFAVFAGDWTGSMWVPDLLLPYAFLMLAFAAFRGTVTGAVLSWKPIAVTGGMCYTIYLYHSQIISFLGRKTMHVAVNGAPYWLNLGIQAVVLLPLLFVVCAVLYVLFERPFMNPKWVSNFSAAWRAKFGRGKTSGT